MTQMAIYISLGSSQLIFIALTDQILIQNVFVISAKEIHKHLFSSASKWL